MPALFRQSVTSTIRSGRAVTWWVLAGSLIVFVTLGLVGNRVAHVHREVLQEVAPESEQTNPSLADEESIDESYIAGQVVDQQGDPVAGADIWFCEWSHSSRKDIPQAKEHTLTDAEGHFRFETPEHVRAPFLWVARGDQFTFHYYHTSADHLFESSFHEQHFGNDPWKLTSKDQLKLSLCEPATTTVQVDKDEGTPVANVQVIPRGMRQRGMPLEWKDSSLEIPDAVAAKLAVLTDENGIAKLPAIVGITWGSIRIVSDSFGTINAEHDYAGLSARSDGPIFVDDFSLHLHLKEKVSGRIVFDDLSRIRGRRVSLIVKGQQLIEKFGRIDDNGLIQRVTATIGDDGTLQGIPPLIAGLLEVDNIFSANESLQARHPDGLFIGFDGIESSHTLEIHVEQAVRVTGIVRKRDTHEPVPRFELDIHGTNMNRDNPLSVITDDQGRYTTLLVPGGVRLDARTNIDNYENVEFLEPRTEAVPEGVAEYELPPYELVPATSVSGKLIGPDGQALGDDWWISGYPERPHMAFVLLADTKQSLIVSGLARLVQSWLRDMEPSEMYIEFGSVEYPLTWRGDNEASSFSTSGVQYDGKFSGRYPSTYPPVRFAACRNEALGTQEYPARVVQQSPLILQVIGPIKPQVSAASAN